MVCWCNYLFELPKKQQQKIQFTATDDDGDGGATEYWAYHKKFTELCESFFFYMAKMTRIVESHNAFK